MWKKDYSPKAAAINTIIGEDTLIKGDINLKGNIIVYGKIEGNVTTKGSITLAVGAKHDGDITGNVIQIGGIVNGNVFAASKVILGDKSFLHGDVRAHHLVIEDGAKFEGKCDMQKTDSQPSMSAK